MTVYIVTKGRYDSYEIVDVFAAQELAEKFIEDAEKGKVNIWLHDDDRHRVETWLVKGEGD